MRIAMVRKSAAMVPQKLACTSQNPSLWTDVGADSARRVRVSVFGICGMYIGLVMTVCVVWYGVI